MELSRRNDHDITQDATIEARLKKWRRGAVLLTSILALNVLAVVPFLAGHRLHGYWDQTGKYLVFLAMGMLVAAAWTDGMAYTLWSHLRDIKRINQDYASPRRKKH